MTPEEHLERGRACLENLDVEGAEKQFHLADHLSGKNPAVRDAAARAYRNSGWQVARLPGRSEDAWRIFQNARALFESLGEGFEFEVAKVCRGLSLEASRLGDYETAADYREISQQWCRQSKEDPVKLGNHLAKLNNDRVIGLHKSGEIDEAVAHLAENWKLIRSLGRGIDPSVVANAETSEGILLVERGHPKKAIRHLERAVRISEKGEDPGRTAKKRLWLVNALIKAGSLEEAALVMGVAEKELSDAGLPYYRLHDLRAMIHLAQGKKGPAIRCLEDAIKVIEANRDLIDTEEFRTSFFGTVQNVYRLLFRLRVSDPVEAFEVTERARARSFLDFLSTGDRRDFSGLLPNDRKRMERKRAEMDELAAKKDPELKKATAKFLMLLRRYEKKVLVEKRVQPAKPVSAKHVCRILESDEALVSYFADEDDVYAFIARRSGIKLRKLPGGRKNLAEHVGALPAVIRVSRREWSRLGEEPIFDDAFRDLYHLLWAPIAKDVGDARRVVIVPCDFLYQVPFPALRDGDGTLSDRHELTTMPSASVFAALRRRPSSVKQRKPRCLLVKDPTETLAHVHGEEQVLRGIFGDHLTVLAGADATPKAFAREARKHDVIHIASHSRFLPGRPALSHFELALGKPYHALDVAGLNLDRCRLVVLSACESGRSSPMGSDEMFGLPRAFMRAGVKCVVATLWRVEDHPDLPRLIGDIHKREVGLECGREREGSPASVWAAFTRFGA
jgi:CHAT domain-containing protein/tetratricopeptide (TPR) repeat protein